MLILIHCIVFKGWKTKLVTIYKPNLTPPSPAKNVEHVLSAQAMDVPLSIGTMLRLERDAWSTVK